MANFYTFLNEDFPIRNKYRHTDSEGNNIETIVDNKHRTYFDFTDRDGQTVGNRIKIDIASIGDVAQLFTHIFIKCKGISSYRILLGPDQVYATTTSGQIVVNITDGDISNEISTRTGIFQHNLHDFSDLLIVSDRTQESITLEFETIGSNAQIHEIFVMNHQVFLDSEGFSDIQPVSKDRTGGIHTAIDGTDSRYETIGDRNKVEIQYEKPIIPGVRELEIRQGENIIGSMKPRDLVNKLEFFEHEHKKFVFEREYSSEVNIPIADDWNAGDDYNTLALPEGLDEHQVQHAGFYFRKTGTTITGLNPLTVEKGNLNNGWTPTTTPTTEKGTELVFPDLVYVAIFRNTEFDTPYWSDVKTNGFSVSFQVCES